MRKLASIRKVKELRPINGADLIELAIVDGWQCVVKKGEFQAGDTGIYFEIDSFLPLIPEFEFLRKSCYKKMGEEEGLRLRTIKLRGELSQGLILPLRALDGLDFSSFEIGDDVTDVIGVKKYDPPVPAQLAGSMAGNFPSFIKKTDQERIQNVWDKYSAEYTDNNVEVAAQLDPEKYADRISELLNNRTVNPIKYMEFEVSLKLDGTSCTYFVCDPKKYQTKKLQEMEQAELPDAYFGVCGRNFEIKRNEDNTYWLVAIRDAIEAKMVKYFEETGRSIALQGELMGPKIQGNREKLNDFMYYVFDIWDIDNQRYMTPEERDEIVNTLDVTTVPFLEISKKVFEDFETLDEILAYAEGPSINNPVREGFVFKSTTLLDGEVISFKAISNKFLLKGGD